MSESKTVRFTLRVPSTLHERVIASTKETNRSLNAEYLVLIEEGFEVEDVIERGAEDYRRLQAQFDERVEPYSKRLQERAEEYDERFKELEEVYNKAKHHVDLLEKVIIAVASKSEHSAEEVGRLKDMLPAIRGLSEQHGDEQGEDDKNGGPD